SVNNSACSDVISIARHNPHPKTGHEIDPEENFYSYPIVEVKNTNTKKNQRKAIRDEMHKISMDQRRRNDAKSPFNSTGMNAKNAEIERQRPFHSFNDPQKHYKTQGINDTISKSDGFCCSHSCRRLVEWRQY